MKKKGRFGDFGGFYVPEVLIPALEELEEAFYRFYKDKQFAYELANLMADYAGVIQGTKYGPVVVPGSRMSSSLYLVVAGKTAPEIRMPPHNDESFAQGRGVMLSAGEIEKIGLWIDQGARDN